MSRPQPAAPWGEGETVAEPATGRVVVPHSNQAAEEGGLPERIGPYSILDELGRGGMGVVYRAEQHEPVHRVVALKIIRPLHREQLDARFRTECHTLARLRHPYVAQVYDAGETEEGDPYFVMEYIAGEPITSYCDRERLTVPERLELFALVCEGIQHAHEHGIVHRDIKPSNVLVTRHGDRAVPKLIDFGVAKHLDDDTGLTRAGQLVGSPSHMSPEQLRAGGRDIDTRTDVWALGTVLYELLTGTTAFFSASGSAFDYLLKIAERDLEAPSARCISLGHEIDAVARNRASEPKALIRSLRHELDWIVLRALAPSRDERYPSAAALATEVRRFLRQDVIEAHPGGRRYRLRKLVARHRPTVIASLVVASVSIAATIAIVVSLMQARAAQHRAQSEAAKAQTINHFLEDLLGSADPAQAGRDVKVLDLIDAKARNLGGELVDQPEVEASLRHTIGRTYAALGVYPEAEAHLARALALRRQALGDEAPDTVDSELAFVELRLRQGDLDAAEMRAAEAAEHLSTNWGVDDHRTLRAHFLLANAWYLRGRYAEAEPLLRTTLERQEATLGRLHDDTLDTVLALAKTLDRHGQASAAESLYRKVHDARVQRFGTDHPDTLESANLLANALYRKGDLAGAEALYRDVLNRRRVLLGAEHHRTLTSMNNLGIATYKQGRYGEAEGLHREALEVQRRVLGTDHPDTLLSLNNLGNALRRQARFGEAETVYREAVSRQRVVLGERHDETARSTLNLINVLASGDRGSEGLDLARQGTRTRSDVREFWDWVVDLEARHGNVEAALEAARERERLAPDHFRSRADIGLLLLRLGRGEEALAAYRHAMALTPDAEAVRRGALEPLDALPRDGRVTDERRTIRALLEAAA